MKDSDLEPLSFSSGIISPQSVSELVYEVGIRSKERDVIPLSELLGAFALTDLTTLLATDSVQKIGDIAQKIVSLQKSVSELPPLGGFCVAGDTAVEAVKRLESSETRVATVVNFPLGHSPLESVVAETRIRLEQGVDEIDLVFPLSRFLSGDDANELINFVLQVKNTCAVFNKPLKTIIQSDELEVGKPELDHDVLQRIEQLAAIAFAGCSDMVKTSTGKGAGSGASLQAAAVISQVAKYFRDSTEYISKVGHEPGVKFSGGISDGATASAFMAVHSAVMGDHVLMPQLFRFGASRLVGKLVTEIACADAELGRKLERAAVDENYFSQSVKGSY